jgi:organic hydroperoxide reductase OsmC/OhrA
MTANAPGGSTLPSFTPGTKPDHDFTLTLDVGERYAQVVDFGALELPSLVIDEPPPLGDGTGPNPAQLLGAAVGGCLGASLLFCMRKAHTEVHGLHTTVRGTLGRNERGRLRVQALHVVLEPVVPLAQHDRVPRCLELFEEFCTVTASIRAAIPVEVEVRPREG